MKRLFVVPVPRWARPLSRRLPLLVVGIVMLTMGAVIYLGFQRVRRLAVDTATAHLQASSHQLVSTLQQGGVRLRREMARIASRPAVGNASSPFASAADVDSATRVLFAEIAKAPQTSSAAVWSRDGKLLFAAGDRTVAESAPPKWTDLAEGRNDTAGTIAPLVARGDSLYIASGARVRVAGGTGGYLVVTRKVVSNPQALALLRGLVGPEARILLGNNSGDLWTDLSRRVRGVGVVADSGSGQHEAEDGTPYIHSIENIPGTPWRIMVDVPRRWATATAGQVVLEMALVAILLMGLGAAVIWLVVHRSLQPLDDVTHAAERVAQGDFTTPVRATGDDEIGRLSGAFNAMAQQVAKSAHELELRATALEESNRELADSEQRYRMLVDLLPDGIVVHRDLQISFANKASAALFGAEQPADLIGCSMPELIGEADARMVMKPTNGSGPHEMTLRRETKRPVLVEATSTALSLGGRNAIQTILHNITERRQLEEQLRQSQKMDAVGRLAGGVAHDFNNILTVIDAHAEFAKRADNDAERISDIDEIRKASASAARLTRQLLAFSRKQAIAPVRIDLSATIQGLVTMLHRLIGESVTIATDFAEGAWPIKADPSQMEQVLLNLSVNARDAMPAGGTLGFKIANTRVGPEYRTAAGEPVPRGDYVMLTVEDTGSGMSEEIQSKVFDPFFTTKQPGQGTGLGLSTVYGIVKQSGGYIWLYSEPGKGTSFKILFPRDIAEGEERTLTRTAEFRIPSRQATVLLVEDQDAVRNAISRAFRKAGFIVHEATSAEAAEELLHGPEGDAVDLIVTDMMMSGKTGAEFTSGPLVADRDIPVVIMSGYSEEFTNREWRLPPNASFVDKPVSPTDLVRLISKLIG
jgi:PAS domain S-box-containing protein